MSDTIIADLFEARYAKRYAAATPPDLNAFEAELQEYRKSLVNRNNTTVSAAAIRNWTIKKDTAQPLSIPKRRQALEFVFNYIAWVLEFKTPFTNPQKNAFDRVSKHLRSRLYSKGTQRFDVNVAFEKADNLFMQDDAILSVVRSVVYASSKNLRSERDDLFRGRQTEDADESYYMMYRYSTLKERIVKSFITIMTPAALTDTFSFKHVVWCRLENIQKSRPSLQDIYRECLGVVAKFETSYYFIGCNFTVPIDRQKNAERYAELRMLRLQRPSGLGLIAFEYDALRQSPGLLSALTMTLAANDQPIAARAALLHIGTSSAARIKINEELIRPCELEQRQFESDFIQTITRLRRAGVESFSENLTNLMSPLDWETSSIRRLKAEVLNLIDNMPAWEKSRQPKRAGKAQGALETIGLPIRPRD